MTHTITARLTENHKQGRMYRGRNTAGEPILWEGFEVAEHEVDAMNALDIMAEAFIEVVSVTPELAAEDIDAYKQAMQPL